MTNIPYNSEQVLKRIGQKLRKMRKQKGFKSAEQFAFTHELNRVQYGYYEQGKKDMRLSSLLKLLNTHQINITAFFNDIENPEEQ